MTDPPLELEPFYAAIHERICSFCVERSAEGRCSPAVERACPLVSHLDLIVPAILSVGGSPEISAYVAAVRRVVCPHCSEDAAGTCALRVLAACPTDAYILPVVEVIEAVAANLRARAASPT